MRPMRPVKHTSELSHIGSTLTRFSGPLLPRHLYAKRLGTEATDRTSCPDIRVLETLQSAFYLRNHQWTQRQDFHMIQFFRMFHSIHVSRILYYLQKRPPTKDRLKVGKSFIPLQLTHHFRFQMNHRHTSHRPTHKRYSNTSIRS